MVNYYRWFLLIPIFILGLGTSILLSNEARIKQLYQAEERAVVDSKNTNQTLHRSNPNRYTTFRDDIKSNRDSAYPYFLLGTGLLIILLVLPKLTELSFSPTSGFTLKVLHDVKQAIDEVKTTTQAVEVKAKQSIRATTGETIMAAIPPDLNKEVKKLEETSQKLEAYSQLLQSMSGKTTRSKN